MAGAFDYCNETIAVSNRMAEFDLLPTVAVAAADVLILANGTSCRHQIQDGTGSVARHVAWLLGAAFPRPATAFAP